MSALDWTILRPGRLTDDPGTGLVALGEEVSRAEIPRADVAAVVAAVLDDESTHGRQWNLVGGSVPVADAIAAPSGLTARHAYAERVRRVLIAVPTAVVLIGLSAAPADAQATRSRASTRPP